MVKLQSKENAKSIETLTHTHLSLQKRSTGNNLTREKSVKCFNNKITANYGITLVALVITIVVLMILAGVAMSLITTDGNLFDKAKLASETYTNAVKEDEKTIAELTNEIDIASNRSYVTLTNEQYKSILDRLDYLENNTLKHIDYTRTLTTITTQNARWVATEDCALVGTLQVIDGYAAEVYIDGITVYHLYVTNHGGNTNICIPVYIKKGSVVTTRAGHGAYSLTAYALSTSATSSEE